MWSYEWVYCRKASVYEEEIVSNFADELPRNFGTWLQELDIFLV